MIYRNLGGQQASAIAAGCMRIAKMEPQALSRFVHTALENGVNFFDHADIYGGGESERVFGRLLSAEPGLRQKLLLQSKCGIRKDMYDFSKEHKIGRAHV